jgi:predicted DNA-binding transcriptional regulator YafY
VADRPGDLTARTYLLARDVERERIPRLPVERFTSAEMGAVFVWKSCPDPNELVHQSYGIVDYGEVPQEVRLRFQPGVADLVRARRWHPTERFEDGPQGTLDLVMDTQGPELARLALEWGDRVEVIGPSDLRQRVQKELRNSLARYGNDATTQ